MKVKCPLSVISVLCLAGIAAYNPCTSLANTDLQVSGFVGQTAKAPVDARLRQSVQLDSESLSDFYKAFQALARQHKVTFVIEGAPVQVVTPSDKVTTLPQNASLSEAVRILSNVFDFDAEFKGNTFILRKRYSDPHDLPSVTLEECSLAVADMIRAYKAYRPVLVPSAGSFSKSPRVGPTVQNLFESLSHDQVAAMKGGTLAISDLDAAQKNTTLQFARFLYVETAYSSLDSVASEFKNLSTTYLQLQENDSRKQFGYGFPSRDGRPVFVVFDQGNSFGNTVSLQKPLGIPKSSDTTTKNYNNSSNLCTTEELLLRLNKRSKVTIVADESMRAKKMLVVGEDYATPAQIAFAVSDIFGARIIDNKEKGISITRKRHPFPSDISGLPAFVMSTVPAPLLRAIHYNAVAPTAPQIPDAAHRDLSRSPDQFREPVRAYLSKVKQWDGRFRDLPIALRSEAGRQLLSSVEARKRNAFGKLPVLNLADSEQNLFALALMGRLLSSISTNLNAIPPRYITSFDALNLQGGIEEKNGRRELSVYFTVPVLGREFKPGLGVVGGVSTVLTEH